MKLIIALLFLFCISACNNEKKKVETKPEVHQEHSANGEHDLNLNNGQKWKSDASTDRNVEVLHTTLQQFRSKSNPSQADYNMLSGQLQENINTMVNECRMKGPDHDALHRWLEPLIQDVKQLKKQDSEIEASKLVKQVEDRVNIYPQYFAES